MLGTRGIWHRGWFADAVHAACPSGWGRFDTDRWGRFDTDRPTVFSGVGEGVCVGRDSGQPVTARYRSPFPFTGGTMHQVIEDVTGKPYLDLEMAAAAAFSRD